MIENIRKAVDETFLNEPIKRWFWFLGALMLMMFVWRRIINLMK